LHITTLHIPHCILYTFSFSISDDYLFLATSFLVLNERRKTPNQKHSKKLTAANQEKTETPGRKPEQSNPAWSNKLTDLQNNSHAKDAAGTVEPTKQEQKQNNSKKKSTSAH